MRAYEINPLNVSLLVPAFFAPVRYVTSKTVSLSLSYTASGEGAT
jgi:hypothetical protein